MKSHREFTAEEVETIKNLYKDHFDYEIAEIVNHPRKSVNAKIQSLGLTGRINGSTLRKMRKWKECEDKYGMPIKDLLYELHWNQKLPVRNWMDKALDSNERSIAHWMEELEVPRRSVSEDNHRRYSTMTEEQIKAQTMAAHEAIREHGQPSNIGRTPWCAGLTKHDHPSLMINSLKHIGENNPMWHVRGKEHPQWVDGKNYWKHADWIETRERVLIRDNYTCQDCGITQEELSNLNGSYLQVHHKIPYRICKAHDPENLITLCPSCHSKADGNIGEGKWKQKRLPRSVDVDLKQSTISQF